MEGLGILFGLALIGWVLIGPFVVFGLRGRVRKLEERVREAERSVVRLEGLAKGKASEGVEKGPVQEEESAFARARGRVQEEQKQGSVELTTPSAEPPPLPRPEVPVASVGSEKVVGSAPTVEPLAPAPSPPIARERGFEEWLEKVGLKPPQAGSEGANVMAWWSTRVGLVLGVIAAVFFGMYVNQNTVPWVRLAELVATSLAVFGGGWWMEKKLSGFGRALSAGGLALLYVSAYAAYGLPAMKVIDAPVLGAVVQILAVALMAGWALMRRNEGVFGLALGLGYVTSWFTIHEGAEPLPLISLMVLVAGGAILFASKGWWSGLWAGLVGSGGGLLLLTVVKWVPDGGPVASVALGSVVGYTVLLIGALYLRRAKGHVAASRLLPVVTTAGLLVGGVIVGLLKIEWEWYYASFAVLLLLVGFAWRGLEEEDGMWEVMWAKASVFVALYLIAKFEGPVRAYALLAQAGTLLWLGRRRIWTVFEVGGGLAIALGWYYLTHLWPGAPVPHWGRDEFEGLAYLVVSFGLLVFFSRGSLYAETRGVVSALLGLLLAGGVVVVGVWRVDHDWVVLVGLGGALLLWGAASFAEMKVREGPMVVCLLGSLAWLLARANEDFSVGWQSLVWLGLVWGICVQLGGAANLVRRGVSLVLMLASVAAVWLMGEDLVGWEWMTVVMLALAALWQGVDGKVRIPDLRQLSVVPALIGGVLALDSWREDLSNGVLVAILLLTMIYWIHGWWLDRGRERKGERQRYAESRGLVLGVVLICTLQMRLDGAMLVFAFVALSVAMVRLWRVLDEEPLSWIGLAAMVFAATIALDEGRVRDGWHEMTVVAVFVGSLVNGLVLAHARRDEILANAKVASLLWGSGAMASVLFGLVLSGEAEGWTTASWAVGAVLLLAAGFWGGLRGYRMVALFGLGCAIVRLFVVDVEDTLWRIIAFGVTSGLLIGIGYVYNRYQRRLVDGDLDWSRKGAVGSGADSEEAGSTAA